LSRLCRQFDQNCGTVTGTLVAVAYDHQRSSGAGTLQWATSVSNRAAASRILTGWAQQLKRELDAARAKQCLETLSCLRLGISQPSRCVSYRASW
jgi:deoxyribodipyrimidine photolyase